MSTTSYIRVKSRYRLRRVAAPKLQHQERRRQEGHWNGNGQGATNDSAEYKAAVRIVNGFPVEYSCLDDPRENDFDDMNVREISVEFAYEMISKDTANVEKSVRSLEWSLLWNVARNLGLHNCNFRKQDPPFNTRRRLSESSSDNYVVGLSSLDFDRFDDATRRCTVLNIDLDKGAICTPMLGTMTAHFTGDKDAIKKYLELNIEQEMNSRRVRIEEVKECLYVGDREGFRPNASTREILDSKNNSTSLALVFGVLAGIFMLCLALLMARGRRRRQDALLGVDNDPLPIPVPPIIFKNQEQLHPSLQPTTSDDTEESMPDKIESAEDSSVEQRLQPVSVTSILSGNAPLPVDPYQLHSTLDEGPEATKRETIGDKANPVLPVVVVPVEFTAAKEPPESKTLKTRRKKRKKKKHRVLNRVSSKQSINEMETINEVGESGGDNEEGSDFDCSEYSASEYSTDDEDDTLRMLRTPIESGSENSNSPKVSPGYMIPPSPIREEPKIRRLPPPWI